MCLFFIVANVWISKSSVNELQLNPPISFKKSNVTEKPVPPIAGFKCSFCFYSLEICQKALVTLYAWKYPLATNEL